MIIIIFIASFTEIDISGKSDDEAIEYIDLTNINLKSNYNITHSNYYQDYWILGGNRFVTIDYMNYSSTSLVDIVIMIYNTINNKYLETTIARTNEGSDLSLSSIVTRDNVVEVAYSQSNSNYSIITISRIDLFSNVVIENDSIEFNSYASIVASDYISKKHVYFISNSTVYTTNSLTYVWSINNKPMTINIGQVLKTVNAGQIKGTNVYNESIIILSKSITTPDYILNRLIFDDDGIDTS